MRSGPVRPRPKEDGAHSATWTTSTLKPIIHYAFLGLCCVTKHKGIAFCITSCPFFFFTDMMIKQGNIAFAIISRLQLAGDQMNMEAVANEF